MDNLNFLTRAKDAIGAFLTSKVTAFFAFAILMTAIIASQNFFFQSIIENGISKNQNTPLRIFLAASQKFLLPYPYWRDHSQEIWLPDNSSPGDRPP